jgi:hypothetical protein
VLLGFEHLHGTHSGRNLANVFLDTLAAANIPKERVLTITSDNASNNSKLVKCLNNALDILDTTFGRLSRVPCLSHVIQLALKELVTHIKITPRNNKVITEWNDDENLREQHTQARLTDGVPWTLKKVCVYL